MASFSLWMQEEIDFFTLYKPLHDPAADEVMIKIRSRFKAKPVPRRDIRGELLKINGLADCSWLVL